MTPMDPLKSATAVWVGGGNHLFSLCRLVKMKNFVNLDKRAFCSTGLDRWDRCSIHGAYDMNNTTGGSYPIQLNDALNETLEMYLLRTRGPKRLSMQIVIPITIVYVFIFVTGVIGNIAVCVVIVRNNFMHTATNYYLFSLAVSDLTLLLLGEYHVRRRP